MHDKHKDWRGVFIQLWGYQTYKGVWQKDQKTKYLRLKQNVSTRVGTVKTNFTISMNTRFYKIRVARGELQTLYL